MDRRATTTLQKLANLPPEVYAQVAEVIMSEFSVPQPSILKTLEAVAPRMAKIPRAKQERRKIPTTTHEDSRASQVRELLMREGPKTTAEIVERIQVPANQIHPLLRQIGAEGVGTTMDAQGDARKVYGFGSALIRDEEPTLVSGPPAS